MKRRTVANGRSRLGPNKGEMLDAILYCAMQYSRAISRFQRRRRARGYDYRCSRLRDEALLRRSLLRVLIAEAQGG